MSAQTKTNALKAPKRSLFHVSLEKKQSLYGYIFVLPIIIGYAAIYIPVMIQSFIYSMSEFQTTSGGGFKTIFVGWQNYYQALFVEEDFLRTVVESTSSLIAQIPVILIFAFFMANILNQKFFGRAAARVIFFIPVIVSTGIISQMESLSSMTDIYNAGTKMETGAAAGLDLTVIENLVSQTLGNSDLSGIVLGAVSGLYSVITSSGVQMLIFLSGLQGISISMYESAKVEGATAWETFWKISFPMISPLILVNLIYTVIDLFTKSDNAAIKYINQMLASSSSYALSSALSWIYMAVVLVFVGVVFLLVQRLVVYQD
ncbi:MAG: carbohydrate ABC transporter permease [Eubacteriales bacterium]